MLEHVPHWLGSALKGLRAGADKLAIVQAAAGQLRRDRPAQPGLRQRRAAARAVHRRRRGRLAAAVLDRGAGRDRAARADRRGSPTRRRPQPLVHAIVWGLPAERRAAGGRGDRRRRGGRRRRRCRPQLAIFREGWLPPDPPTGHGEHRYAFQLFALAAGEDPGDDARAAATLVEAMAGGCWRRGC